MRQVLGGLFVMAGLSIVGCGGTAANPASNTATKPDVAVGSTEELKKMLEGIADTGAAGSAAAGLRPSIVEYAKKDSAKGAALLKSLDQLEKESDGIKIKAIAKRMVEQL